jgi:hypothetical protein
MVIAKGKGKSDPNILLSKNKEACEKRNALVTCNSVGIGILMKSILIINRYLHLIRKAVTRYRDSLYCHSMCK